MIRRINLLVVAIVIATAGGLATPIESASAYHDVCRPFEVGKPYKTQSNVRAWGDARCTLKVSQLDVEIEIWARNNGANFWYRLSRDWASCGQCAYAAVTETTSCLYGMTRSFYARVRAVYLLHYLEYYYSGWKQSETATFYC
jgi:hypothetical protein